MKTKIAILAVVLSVAGAGLVWQTMRLNRIESMNQELRTQTASLATLSNEVTRLSKTEVDQAEVVRLREEATAMKAELAQLKGETVAMTPSTRTNSAPGSGLQGSRSTRSSARSTNISGAGGASASAGGEVDWIRAATGRQLDAQMAQARERLNLNPDQDKNIRATVEKAIEQGKENLQNVLTGKARTDEVPTVEQWSRGLEQQIMAQLTPEQQTAYQAYKREDINASARLMANGELMQVQSTLGLSQDQQDQMFNVIYEHSVKRLNPDPSQPATGPTEPLAALEYQTAQMLAALEPVLTPQQMESYRQIQAARIQYVKGIFSKH
jgi:hypothetical protein